MQFEWDEDKNRRNVEKHGISFEQATGIFDGFTFSRLDDRFDYSELREISIGRAEGFAILVVVHTDRDGVCRLISARQARRDERKRYDEELRKALDA